MIDLSVVDQQKQHRAINAERQLLADIEEMHIDSHNAIDAVLALDLSEKNLLRHRSCMLGAISKLCVGELAAISSGKSSFFGIYNTGCLIIGEIDVLIERARDMRMQISQFCDVPIERFAEDYD